MEPQLPTMMELWKFADRRDDTLAHFKASLMAAADQEDCPALCDHDVPEGFRQDLQTDVRMMPIVAMGKGPFGFTVGPNQNV